MDVVKGSSSDIISMTCEGRDSSALIIIVKMHILIMASTNEQRLDWVEFHTPYTLKCHLNNLRGLIYAFRRDIVVLENTT